MSKGKFWGVLDRIGIGYAVGDLSYRLMGIVGGLSLMVSIAEGIWEWMRGTPIVPLCLLMYGMFLFSLFSLMAIAAAIATWRGRGINKLTFTYDSLHHYEKTNKGTRYKIAVRNDSLYDLKNVCVRIISIEAKGESKRKRQGAANAAVGHCLQLSHGQQDTDNKSGSFGLALHGDEQLVNVVHIWNSDRFYLLVAGRDGIKTNSGMYEIKLRAISEKRVFGETTICINRSSGGDPMFTQVIA